MARFGIRTSSLTPRSVYDSLLNFARKRTPIGTGQTFLGALSPKQFNPFQRSFVPTQNRGGVITETETNVNTQPIRVIRPRPIRNTDVDTNLRPPNSNVVPTTDCLNIPINPNEPDLGTIEVGLNALPVCEGHTRPDVETGECTPVSPCTPGFECVREYDTVQDYTITSEVGPVKRGQNISIRGQTQLFGQLYQVNYNRDPSVSGNGDGRVFDNWANRFCAPYDGTLSTCVNFTGERDRPVVGVYDVKVLWSGRESSCGSVDDEPITCRIIEASSSVVFSGMPACSLYFAGGTGLCRGYTVSGLDAPNLSSDALVEETIQLERYDLTTRIVECPDEILENRPIASQSGCC